MTYLVNDKCIMCKHTSCVEVCPVDCFYEGENTLAINPDECIDCGVCEPECPEEAIIPDHLDEDNKWLDFNTKWSNKQPQITEAKDPMTEYAKHSGEEGKLEKYFKDEQLVRLCCAKKTFQIVCECTNKKYVSVFIFNITAYRQVTKWTKHLDFANFYRLYIL